MADEDTPDKTPDTSWDTVRRCAAGIVVLLTAGLVVGSQYLDALAVCTPDENASASGSGEICGPFPVVATIPLFVLAAALLWKDLNAFEIAGIGRIERRQQELQESQARIETQLMAQLQSQNQGQSQSLHIGDVASLARRSRTSLSADDDASDPTDPEAAFRTTWEELRPWAQLASRLRDPVLVETLGEAERAGKPLAEASRLAPSDRQLLRQLRLDPEADLDRLLGWATRSTSALEAVKQAHRNSSDSEELADATVVASDLLADLRSAGFAAKTEG